MTALDDLKKEVTALQTELEALSKQVVIVGTIVPYGGESEPGDGWLLCDGRPLDRGEYPDLYRVIGANFGAPDKSHFNLPDLQGRFVRGVDHDAARDPDADSRTSNREGGNVGNKVGSVQEDACQSHMHWYSTTAWSYSESEPGTDFLLGNTHNNKGRFRDTLGKALHHGTTDPPADGARQSAETRPKNVYVNWIIYAGV